MQEGRCVFYLAMIVVLLLPTANGDHVFEHQAELRSALTVDVDCLFLDNLTCEFEQAQHTLDYFSADWCGPCVDVDYTLSELNQENLSVLLHPVSFEDETYSYDSILLFEETYRLLIIPSVIVNGETLYTGSRQTDDLSVGINATESLHERTNISIQNKTIMFQLDDDEMKIIIKKLWSRADGQVGRMLRVLRDEEKIACEQGRFATLFREVKEAKV